MNAGAKQSEAASLHARSALCRAAALIACAVFAATPAFALYKVVGPDGKVTYTDRPPTQSARSVVPLTQSDAAESGAALPPALRRTAERFPVTLYVADGCSACDSARQLLNQRGIPYSERRVASRADLEAFERLSGGREAPTLTIGSQVLRGFAPPLWQQYLDAAGYPAESRLPANYRPPPPRPLAERSEIGAASSTAAQSAADAASAPAPTPAPRPAPGGIRF